MSSTLDSYSEEPSKPLRDAGTTPPKQRSHKRSSAEENPETGLSSSKRRRSITDRDNVVSKRLRKDSEFPSDSQDKPGQDELDNTFQAKRCIPHQLIGLMYQLDLSMLCLLRKYTYERKYPSLSLAFGDSEIDKFSNIVLRYKGKSIHIQVEHVDNYIHSNISYARLFNKERRSSSINSYFDSFVKHVISKLDSLYNVEYLTVYTNSGLDLTKGMELKQGRSKNFYPFKFYSINIEEYDILKNFLFTSNNAQGHGFYQFSRDKATRVELLKQLKFSPIVQKVIKKKELPRGFEKEVKEAFFDKLVFAVNQPSREKLNSIVKSEIGKNRKIQDNYTTLQERILSNLATPERHKKFGNYIFAIPYEFNLLMSFLHAMFLHKNVFSIKFEGKIHGISNGIAINYKDRITYVKVHDTNSSVGYSQLFPFEQEEKRNTFSINKHFTFFIEELERDTRYFIIHTNVGLDLTEERVLKEGRSKDFYPLKFNSIDIRKKKYKILRDCLRVNGNGLYQFSQQETTREKLLSLLKLPPSLQKKKEEGRFSSESEKEMKEKFLDKLIFSVNQPNKSGLNDIIRDEVEKDNGSDKVPYNYEELHEIASRCLESHGFGSITKGIMEELLNDIRNNRSSCQGIEDKDINEAFQFSRSVVGREGTPVFYQFLGFLVKGEGGKCLVVLKGNGINMTNISSILHGSGDSAVKAFKDLYDLLFDGKGNKTRCLKALEENGINVVNMSSILHGARANAANAFEDLYDLWFNEEGNKTRYLETLEENEINLTNVSSILSGAGVNAAKAFRDLYDTWFDDQGEKKQCLISLEKERINLANVSSILGGAGANAAKAFKSLHDLWFDGKGNKTQYLKTLEREGIDLSNISSILHRSGANAAKAFVDLYDLWFDGEGNQTGYLRTLEGNEINLANVSSILAGAGANAAKAFKGLHDLWFDAEGNKKQCLKTLEENRIVLANVSSVLGGAGATAAKAFKGLYDLLFDRNGGKTQYLKTLEREGIDLSNMSSILHGAGNWAAKAFRDLYDLLFDGKGNRAQYLKTLEKEGIDLSNISNILHGTGNGAARAFKDLYDTLFDQEGNKSQYLKDFTERKDGERSFTMRNLSGMLGGAGAKVKDTFEKLHDVCFNDRGEEKELLSNFYNVGFEPRNLSCMLCGAGPRASSILKRLHSVCFNEKGEKAKLLKDFFDKAGFRPCDLCNILSGAVDSLEQFHAFCFRKGTRKYLNHFLDGKESFTPSNLCNILHGTEANVCSALKDFHDICFDEAGEKRQLLDDFSKIGFTPDNLSDILSMAGSNAASVLRSLHELCFDQDNYLDHFLAENELFGPKGLSKILYGVGTKISPSFRKLHDLCFDRAGNRTNYLNDLAKSNTPSKILDILYKKVRKAPYTFLDD